MNNLPTAGSVALGRLNGELTLVVGAIDGKVYAFSSSGQWLWTFDSGTSTSISGKAAISDIDGNGSNEVIVATGSADANQGVTGKLLILDEFGREICHFDPPDTDGDLIPDAIISSPAVAALDATQPSHKQIAFGVVGFAFYVVREDCSVWWTKQNIDGMVDSFASSAAIGDLDGDGTLDIVVGEDSNKNLAFNTIDGGLIHAFHGDGKGGELTGFPISIDEVVQSSPVLADITGDGKLDVIVGTGRCWDNPNCAPGGQTHVVTEAIYAWNNQGKALAGWPKAIPGQYAAASPAIADLDEDGSPEVIINTINKSSNEGKLYVLKGDGSLLAGWPKAPMTPATCETTVSVATSASPIVADLDGDSHLEVVLPSNTELVVWKRNGNQLSRSVGCPPPVGVYQLLTNYSVNASAIATDLDEDGSLELLVSGGSLFVPAGQPNQGALYAWHFGADATVSKLGWPEFRRTIDNIGVYHPNLIFSNNFD